MRRNCDCLIATIIFGPRIISICKRVFSFSRSISLNVVNDLSLNRVFFLFLQKELVDKERKVKFELLGKKGFLGVKE